MADGDRDGTQATHLPPELERYIFEIAALDHREIMLSLILVAHRAKAWIEPWLYRTVIRGAIHHSTTAKGESYPWYRPPADQLPSYGHHVRNLLFSDRSTPGNVEEHLSKCLYVENLALWGSQPLGLFPKISELKRLRRVTFGQQGIVPYVEDEDGGGGGGGSAGYDFSHPVFDGVTHLDLLDGISTWESIRSLRGCKSLTHLALPEEGSGSGEADEYKGVVERVLKECKGLKVLTLHQSSLEEDDVGDVRAVLCKYSLESYEKDWIDQAEGRRDFWTDAEEVVQERRWALENGKSGD
ncbi:hypothetical protein BDN72DRAFT_965724 [Pluteus cervinus]|uniref:Uncharacterized protein n=1 Tax=Pluteus cervinus TaxID=181527 RepID=A0ACD3A3W9_9AGAR|nr:hypothetical protein BDN72DRAFT_965724 [Pluteus cervinus]